jgi:hypothetical protein
MGRIIRRGLRKPVRHGKRKAGRVAVAGRGKSRGNNPDQSRYEIAVFHFGVIFWDDFPIVMHYLDGIPDARTPEHEL